MKILHVTPTYYPATYWGGPIFSVYGLNNALAALPNIRLKVLTTDAAGAKVSNRLKTIQLDKSMYPNYDIVFSRRVFGSSVSLELLRRLPNLIRWADIVHLTATYSFPTIPVLLLTRLYGKPLVWSPRGAILDDQKLNKVRKKHIKKLWLKLCNAVIKSSAITLHVTSEEEKSASLAEIPNANAVVVRNGINVSERMCKKKFLDGNKINLLFIGRLATKKGIENLLDALHLLHDPTITLTICGTGEKKYETQLKEKAGDLGLYENGVVFAGHVDGDEKRNAFLNSDVCVVPSHSENFAMVVAEALAFGVPVIASTSTPWQGLDTHHCGLWVDNTPESLAGAIKSIRKMDLPLMGYNGWLWMRDEFSWELIAEKMLDIYRKML